MPDIAIAPNPAAVPAGAATPGAAAADAGGTAAASGPLGAEAFAALLQKQLAGGSIDATAILLGTAESPAQGGAPGAGLAALLPQFLAGLGLGQKGQGEMPGQTEESAEGAHDIPVLTDVYAPPAAPVTPAVLQRAAAANDAAGSAAPALAADATAKLAARALPEPRQILAETPLPALSADGKGAPDAATLQAAMQAAQAAGPQAATPRGNERIEAPVGSRVFQEALGERLTWMVGQQQSKAELILNPPQLGRVEISLTVNGDNASALFVSANPAVRETLEAALPRLREILADAGVTLGQAQVDSGATQSSAGGGEKGDNSRSPAGAEALPLPRGAVTQGGTDAIWMQRGRGLVDTFA